MQLIGRMQTYSPQCVPVSFHSFHKVVETMPRRMCTIIKAKGGPMKY
uniref:Uncharacterized protein n=1 Tax=Anguilla anguilla TaxID=7936 RepID=A0A0E9XF88_ANGAN